MDSFFGIGAPELIVILILAGIVMGPQRIRQVALWLGKTTAQLQAISRGFVRQLNAELDSVDQGGELKSTMKEVQELRRQVSNLRRELTSSALGTVNAGQSAIDESRQLIENSIMPPELADDDGNSPAPSTNAEEKDVASQPEAPAGEDETSLPAAAGQSTPARLPNLLHVPDDPE